MKISVVAHPNSKKPRVEKDLVGDLHVYVNYPPLEGKANDEILKSLAKFLNVKKNSISLIRGQKSKRKVFEVAEFI
jgi:uncharacterized protein YggU (UPF0235/DUF167 family)